MSKCTKCGTGFVGTAENPPKDGLCRYCEIDELRAAQYVPGAWHCAKCGFVTQLNILYTKNGAIGADTTVADRACPNDGELMEQLTWKQLAKNYEQVCAQQIERAVKAERQLDESRSLMDDIRPYVNPRDWNRITRPEYGN